MSTISLAPLCEVEMIGGQANEAITVGTSASFSLISTLDIEVLDKGLQLKEQPSLLMARPFKQMHWVLQQHKQRLELSMLKVMSEGTKTVTMQIGSFTEFFAWNVQQSTSHTFMASTVPTGTITSG